jgi:hypothetical protein
MESLSFVLCTYIHVDMFLLTTSYIWGSRLIEVNLSRPDVPQLTESHCIYIKLTRSIQNVLLCHL